MDSLSPNLTAAIAWRCHFVVKFPANEPGPFVVDAWGDFVASTAGAATEPRYVTLEAVAKQNGDKSPHIVANEWVSMKLGLALELPIVMGAVSETEDGDELVYLSFRFGRKSEAPPPIIPEHLVADFPFIAAGVVAFDIWIGNEDRHDENLAYTRGRQPVAIFDHSHALFRAKREGKEGLEKRMMKALVGGCIAPELRSEADLNDWATRINSIKDTTVANACESALQHGAVTEDECNALKQFLVCRKARIPEFISQARGKFKNLKTGEVLL